MPSFKMKNQQDWIKLEQIMLFLNVIYKIGYNKIVFSGAI